MEDHLRRKLPHRLFQRNAVAYIAANVVHNLANVPHGEEIRIGGRVERIASNHRSLGRKPQRQPPSLEAGVTGEKDFAALPRECARSRHRFEDTWLPGERMRK